MKIKQLPFNFKVLLWIFIWVFIILSGVEYSMSKGYPFRFSGLEQYLLRSGGDAFFHIPFEIQRIATRGEPEKSRVIVYLGGSAARRAIYSEKMIEEQLSSMSNLDVRFSDLTGGHRTFIDDLNIVNEIGALNVTYIISTEPLQYRKSPKKVMGHMHNRLYPPFHESSAALLNKYGADVGMSDRLFLSKAASSFGESIKKSLLYSTGLDCSKKCKKTIELSGYAECLDKCMDKDFTIRRNDYDFRLNWERPLPDKENLSRMVETKYKSGKLFKLFKKNRKFNLETITAVISSAQTKGNKVILIELPQNPLFNEHSVEMDESYERMIQKLINKTSVQYIDMRKEVEWEIDDFSDAHHMTNQGSIKMTNALLTVLADLFSR